MTPKKSFERDTKYADYDLDGDGTITDEELAYAKQMKHEEAELRKFLAQRRMATYTLIGMAVFTIMLFMPFIPDKRIELLSDVSDLFYITGAGIVGAYMGVSAWMGRKGGGNGPS